MKLISLNTWGGKCFDELMKFVEFHAPSTQVFCLQEILDTEETDLIVMNEFRVNLLHELEKRLQGFSLFHSVYIEDSFVPGVSFGTVIFIKNGIDIIDNGDFFIHGANVNNLDGDDIDYPRKLQYIEFSSQGNKYIICNVHGAWIPDTHKLDTPGRILQSKLIVDFIQKTKGKKILCGDFNLQPCTKSIEMIENTGMKNLIKQYKIESTRSSKKYDKPLKYADYTFVSDDIAVNSFEVPDIPISDHLPMILYFDSKVQEPFVQ